MEYLRKNLNDTGKHWSYPDNEWISDKYWTVRAMVSDLGELDRVTLEEYDRQLSFYCESLDYSMCHCMTVNHYFVSDMADLYWIAKLERR